MRNSIGLISGTAIAGITWAVIFICVDHTVKRDKEIIHDLAAIEKITGENATIRTTPALWSNWSFQNYGMRYHGFNFDADENSSSKWLLTEKMSRRRKDTGICHKPATSVSVYGKGLPLKNHKRADF